MLVKKGIAVFLTAIIVCSCMLGGCAGGGKQEAKADAYLEMAQEYLDDGDMASAKKILQKGYDETDDQRLALKLVELAGQEAVSSETTAATEEVTQATQAAASTEEATQPTQAAASTEEATQATQATAAAEEPTQPIQATVPPTQATQSTLPPQQNRIDSFSSEERHAINIFISNFCEQFMDRYPTDKYGMLQYAYLYAKINSHDLIFVEDGHYCINKSDVDRILNRFFGYTVSPDGAPFVHSDPFYTDEILFKDGKYQFVLADGESYNHVANVYHMSRRTDGTYDVYFDIYEVSLEVYHTIGLHEYYDIKPDDIGNYPEMKYFSSGHAVVRDYITDSGYETYQLLEYMPYE